MVWGGRWWIGKVCGAVLKLGGGDGQWSGSAAENTLCLSCFLWISKTFVIQRIHIIMIMY
jgi:hypothetical protein